jgi:hypothetical protein
MQSVIDNAVLCSIHMGLSSMMCKPHLISRTCSKLHIIRPDPTVLHRLLVIRMQAERLFRFRLLSSSEDLGAYPIFHLDSCSPF